MMISRVSRVSTAPALRPVMAARASVDEIGVPEPAGDEPNVKKLGGLVLTRHLGESIMIGEDVEVEVVGLKSGTVRLKVVAPRTIPVHRREIFDSIHSEPAPVAASPRTEPVAPRPGKPGGGLVLARSTRQSIMIGEHVEIGVVEVRPSTVKLRIVAPRSVEVHRREVYESLRRGPA
jgi:carbon storage regulator